MLEDFSTNREQKTNVKRLYKTLTSGEIELLGVSYNSDKFPTGVTIQSYIEGINNEDDGLQFINKINVIESFKQAVIAMNNELSSSGLGFIKTEQLNNSLEETGLMTDLLLKGTNLTSTRQVDVISTFIEPKVTYQDISIAQDIKLRLYKLEEKSPLNNYKHSVYLLTTPKTYDGQTLLGMLSKKGKLNKPDTEKLIAFFRKNKLINRSVFSVKLDTKDYNFSLYNTNETGIFFLEDSTEITIACGQSYVKITTDDIKSSKVTKVKDNIYAFEVQLKGNSGKDKLSIKF